MTRVAHENREGDYPEDFEHENGNYINVCYSCDNTFTGLKIRTCCRKCHDRLALKRKLKPNKLYNTLCNRIEDLARDYGYEEGRRMNPLEYIESVLKIARTNSDEGFKRLSKAVLEARPDGC